MNPYDARSVANTTGRLERGGGGPGGSWSGMPSTLQRRKFTKGRESPIVEEKVNIIDDRGMRK